MTNASTAEGREPIDAREWMRAAGEGDAARVRSLLSAGADVNATLESGETALIRAASKGHLQVVQVLLAAGADPNAEREDGFTALGVAVFFGYADIVRALLAGGADPNAKGRLGTTAEKWARFSGFKEIVEMLNDPAAVGAQQDAAGAAPSGTEKTAAPEFFPTEGTFSPVVPLSKIEEAPDATEGAAAVGRSVEVDELGVVPGAVEVSEDAGEKHEPKEQEVATLIRARASQATPPRTAHGPRPGVARKTWPVALVVLALILFAGLIADAYWKRSRQSAENVRPESAETQGRAPVAEDAAPPAEALTQAPEPQPSAATSDDQPSQPAAQLPEPSLPAATVAEADSRAPVAAAEVESKSERADRERGTASRPATTTASASEGRRAARAAPAPRREAAVNATARAARQTPHAVGEQTGGRRRAPVALVGRARRTEGRVLSSSSRDTSLPVFSPSPSARSSKKKVIPWP
jgi:hypothetical protein